MIWEDTLGYPPYMEKLMETSLNKFWIELRLDSRVGKQISKSSWEASVNTVSPKCYSSFYDANMLITERHMFGNGENGQRLLIGGKLGERKCHLAKWEIWFEKPHSNEFSIHDETGLEIYGGKTKKVAYGRKY